MQMRPVQLKDVFYNAANQSFEALVTVHDGENTKNYACAISAPIEMTFEDAAKGLKTQALRRHKSNAGLASRYVTPRPLMRAGRSTRTTIQWLENLIRNPIRRVA